MARIFITLKPQERDALQVLAQREFRDPRAQAALIIRQHLERRGLLPQPNQPTTNQPQPQPREVKRVCPST